MDGNNLHADISSQRLNSGVTQLDGDALFLPNDRGEASYLIEISKDGVSHNAQPIDPTLPSVIALCLLCSSTPSNTDAQTSIAMMSEPGEEILTDLQASHSARHSSSERRPLCPRATSNIGAR